MKLIATFLTICMKLIRTYTNNLYVFLRSQICHIILGLRPASKEEERDIIMGWVERDKRRGLRLTQTWYLISMPWWRQWTNFVNSKVGYNGVMNKEKKKLYCYPPLPAPICWNSEKKFLLYKWIPIQFFEIPEKKGFFSFKTWNLFWTCLNQFSTLLNWFKELMKWFISKIAP